MKKTGLLILLQVFAINMYAQVCCHAPSSEVTLAASFDEFQTAHLAPKPLNYQSKPFSSMIKFATEDGRQANAFYVPARQSSTEVLIIFHEWWGLNDYMKKEAERWQEKLGNIDVYVVDLYDGQVATDAKEAAKLSNALTEERGQVIIKGLLAQIGLTKRIATLGWCMGGYWAIKATELMGDKSAGTVVYYGYPETNDEKVKTIKSDVLYIYATQDKFISKEIVDQFEKQVMNNGKKFERHNFNAVHAFANPSNPKFAGKETVEAEQYALEFLKKRMQL